MTTTLLLAPSAAGKTRACIRRVRQIGAAQPAAAIWVVTPGRFQAAAFRRRLAATGESPGPQVGTFGDLYQDILERAGRLVNLVAGPALDRLVRAVIGDLRERDMLEHYASIAHTPGFLRVVRDRLAELKRARVRPETLQLRASSPAVVDIARLYATYQSRLQALDLADTEGLSWLAVEALERDPTLISDCELLVVDGFDSFEGAQRDALRLIGAAIPQLLITLPGTPTMDRAAHRRFARAFDNLKTILPKLQVETLPGRPHLAPALAHLERALFEPGASTIAATRQIGMVEARSPAEEAREALRWLKARIVRDAVAADQCAIITPDPARYRSRLREVAAEFGLALRFGFGEPLTTAPPVVALLDLLDLAGSRFTCRAVLDAIRSPYFDLGENGPSPEDAAAIEAAARYGQVIEGLDQWAEVFARLEQAPPRQRTSPYSPPSDLPIGEAAAQLWLRLQALASRIAAPGARPADGWAGWLEELLRETRFFERGDAERDLAAFEGLRAALAALVQGAAVAGDTALEYADFLAALRGALDRISCQEQLAPEAAMVHVLGLLEARGLRFRAVAIVGLAEGVFPELEREDPFLSEAIRADLGLEPRLGREQRGLFYQAVTRADEYLLVTRPFLADDGERWEPSPYWDAVATLVAEPAALIHPDTGRPIADAASAEEVLCWSMRRGGLAPELAEALAPRWEMVQHAAAVFMARQSRSPGGQFEGDLSDLTAELGTRFGRTYLWSANRLETYGGCPLRFYVEVVLGMAASAPPAPGLNASQIGSLLHTILEQTYRQAGDLRDPEALGQVLNDVAQAAFATAPQVYGFRPTPLWEIEQVQLLAAVIETVRALGGGDIGWTPIWLEQTFGAQGQPELELKIGTEHVALSGTIDRVDRNAAGELRIVDYKTGGRSLEKQDLLEGRRLQLPLYALAVQRALGFGQPIDGIYWSILGAKPAGLRLGDFQHQDAAGEHQGVAGAIEIALAHVERAVRGVRSGAFPPQPPPDGCPSYCAAAGWCWRYRPE